MLFIAHTIVVLDVYSYFRLGIQQTEIDATDVRIMVQVVVVADLLVVVAIFEESITCKDPLTILAEVVDEVVKARAGNATAVSPQGSSRDYVFDCMTNLGEQLFTYEREG